MTSTLFSASVFFLTLLIGVWAAYDRPAAWGRFALLGGGLLAALGIAWLGRRVGARALAWVGVGCSLLAAAIGIYFVLTYDWQARGVSKVPFLYAAGLWLQTHRPALPVPEDIHSNIAGSAIALGWSLGAGGLVYARRQRWPGLIPLAVAAALLVAGAALLLTTSRGAWLGLGAGAGLAGFLTLRPRTVRSRRMRWLLDGAIALWLCLLAALILVSVIPSPVSVITDSSLTSRPHLWRWGLDLIADYPFTGSGLGSTMMVLSSYVLMLHVGFIHHVHNLYLQLAVEQGIFGLIAFAALVVLGAGRIWRAYRTCGPTPMGVAAAVALVTLLVHGVVDAGLYGSRLGPVLFLPLGCALGLDEAGGKAQVKDAAKSVSTMALASALAFAAILVVASALLPSARAAFQANLGAVSQTRAELSVYRWPAWPLQDALRRQAPGSPPPVDLAPAIARYRAALALDPRNPVANRRLGQVELSQGRYDAAQGHLETAFRAAPDQQAARFLLGESEAIAGRIESAATLWKGVGLKLWWNDDWAGAQSFELRRWWYGAVGETANQQRISLAIQQLAAGR